MASIKTSIVLLLCLGIVFATTQPKLNYYEKIGVSQNTLAKDIRKAYVQIASNIHAEKSQDTKEAQQFIELANAYEILSDSTKRGRYNTLLESGQTEYTEGAEEYKFMDAQDVFKAAVEKEAASDSTMTLVITGVIMVVGSVVIYTMYGNQTQKKKEDKKKQMLDKVKTRQHKDETKPSKTETEKRQQALKQEKSKPVSKAPEPEPVQQPSAFEEEEPLDLEEEGVEGEDAEQPKQKARDRSAKKNDAPSSEFYCAVCRKAFKSTSQWENHERSKKHKDELKRLNL